VFYVEENALSRNSEPGTKVRLVPRTPIRKLLTLWDRRLQERAQIRRESKAEFPFDTHHIDVGERRREVDALALELVDDVQPFAWGHGRKIIFDDTLFSIRRSLLSEAPSSDRS
jgi:hypothetical protein